MRATAIAESKPKARPKQCPHCHLIASPKSRYCGTCSGDLEAEASAVVFVKPTDKQPEHVHVEQPGPERSEQVPNDKPKSFFQFLGEVVLGGDDE